MLSGPSQQKLDVCAHFLINLSNQFQSTQEIYVIRGLRKAAIKALQVVQQVEPVQANKCNIVKIFQNFPRAWNIERQLQKFITNNP